MKKRYLSTIFLSTLICAFLQSPVRAHWLPTTLTGAVTVMAGYAARRSYKVMKEAERTLKAKKDDLWAQTVHKNARAMFHKSMAAGGVAGIATIFLALRKKTAPTDPNTTDATTLTRKTRRLAEAYAGPKADIICTDDVTAFRQDLEAMLIMNPQTSKADECTAALPFAVQTGSTEIIDFCMQNGADINHRDPMSKKSMLEIALEKKNAPLVAIFLKQYGAIYDQQKLDAALPDLIIESIAADKLLTASCLASYSNSLNTVSSNGKLPLVEAVKKRNIALIHALVDNGADATVADGSGQSATSLIASEEVDLLLAVFNGSRTLPAPPEEDGEGETKEPVGSPKPKSKPVRRGRIHPKMMRRKAKI